MGTRTAEQFISIHSPRMGRDAYQYRIRPKELAISIHSPRMGRDSLSSSRALHTGIFQSTLPAWGETRAEMAVSLYAGFQSTLPAWGETRPPVASPELFHIISIHSPRMGRDASRSTSRTATRYFNPLSPHGERQQTHTTFRREKLAHLHNIVSFRQQRGSSC